MTTRTKITIACALVFGSLLFSFVFSYIQDPSSFISFYINPNDEKLYMDIEVWIFEKSFPFYNLGPSSRYIGQYWNVSQFIRWSPNKKNLAFISDIVEPDFSFDREFAINVFNPRTFRTKTVVIGNWKSSNYYWIDNKTIRIFIGMGTGAGTYKDIAVDTEKPLIVAEELRDENAKGWNFITLGDMYDMENGLKLINHRY